MHRLEVSFSDNSVAVVFYDVAALYDGYEVLCSADFSL